MMSLRAQRYYTVSLDDLELADSILASHKAANHENNDNDVASTEASTEAASVIDELKFIDSDRRNSFLLWVYRVIVTMSFFTVLLVCIVLVGARIEKRAYDLAPSTLSYYTTPNVCAMRESTSTNPQVDFSTFPIAHEAHLDGYKVAHCGSCGKCSNLHDIDIQAETTNTLTADSTACAFLIFTGGTQAVHECLQERIGFTKPCEDCWVDDIQCNVRHCKYTCIKVKYFFRDMGVHNEEDGGLNDCLLCDEKMCGPRFIECSGSNRRRLGIVSDIGRDIHEKCSVLDVNWAV